MLPRKRARLALEIVCELVEQPALADAGLASHQHESAGAPARATPRRAQLRELVLASDERKSAAVEVHERGVLGRRRRLFDLGVAFDALAQGDRFGHRRDVHFLAQPLGEGVEFRQSSGAVPGFVAEREQHAQRVLAPRVDREDAPGKFNRGFQLAFAPAIVDELTEKAEIDAPQTLAFGEDPIFVVTRQQVAVVECDCGFRGSDLRLVAEALEFVDVEPNGRLGIPLHVGGVDEQPRTLCGSRRQRARQQVDVAPQVGERGFLLVVGP